MMKNSDYMKNKKIATKMLIANNEEGKLAKYANAPYFKKKDKKAAAFLQKHPIPEKFLK